MPYKFTNAEYADMHYIYGFCDGNAHEAVNEYRRRYRNRRAPNYQVFIDTHRQFGEFGLRRNNERDREENRRQRRDRIRILRSFDNDRKLSSRKAAQHLHVSQSKVIRTLRKDHRKAFHFQPVQGLHPGDSEKRLRFCRWLLNSVNENPQFLHKILWTDESCFTRRGIVNFHNLHTWNHENPHEIRPSSFQNEFSVNVWVGVQSNYVCGPHFLPPRLNAALFLDFLENNLNEYFDDAPLNMRVNGWIQMDGALAHNGRIVKDWLNNNYPERWIGRINNDNNQELIPGVGPFPWPPRSPDLNPLDYCVWGYLKEKVYFSPVQTREELVLRIEDATNSLKESDFLIPTINSLITRCRKCIEVEGLHFEQLL